MNGLVIGGLRCPVPSTEVITWEDDPRRAPPVTDGKRRDPAKVLAVCLHTSRGQRGAKLQPGGRPSTRAEALARYQSTTEREVSWHLTIDTDGTVIQSADLGSWMCWHAGHVNGWTVGIELVQHPDSPDLWQDQLAALCSVCAVISDTLQIPRRLMVDGAGSPILTPVGPLLSEAARSRAKSVLPKQGKFAPWKLRQNYFWDFAQMKASRLEDGTLKFLDAGAMIAPVGSSTSSATKPTARSEVV